LYLVKAFYRSFFCYIDNIIPRLSIVWVQPGHSVPISPYTSAGILYSQVGIFIPGCSVLEGNNSGYRIYIVFPQNLHYCINILYAYIFICSGKLNIRKLTGISHQPIVILHIDYHSIYLCGLYQVYKLIEPLLISNGITCHINTFDLDPILHKLPIRILLIYVVLSAVFVRFQAVGIYRNHHIS